MVEGTIGDSLENDVRGGKGSGISSSRSVHHPSVFSLDGGLYGLPMRVSNEDLRARAFRENCNSLADDSLDLLKNQRD